MAICSSLVKIQGKDSRNKKMQTSGKMVNIKLTMKKTSLLRNQKLRKINKIRILRLRFLWLQMFRTHKLILKTIKILKQNSQNPLRMTVIPKEQVNKLQKTLKSI